MRHSVIEPPVGALARLADWAGRAFSADPGQARLFEDEAPRALARGGRPAAEAMLRRARDGRVDLVGAGPGDPELLTLRARRLLGRADVVIHDRLTSAAVLRLARHDAALIDVGKRPGAPSWAQADINALMVRHARRGKAVVRLKSGDPGVFGRLDEEVAALTEAGVAHAVTPGVTAAAAAAAGARASLTRRGRNAALHVVTGRGEAGFAEHDWAVLAKPGAVTAVYMGVGAAPTIRDRLLAAGADPDAPATAVENASQTEARSVVATVATLPEAMAADGLVGPAVQLLGVAPAPAVAAAEDARSALDLALAAEV